MANRGHWCAWGLGLCFLGLLGCKEEQKEYLPTQEEADHRYLMSKLALVCDGRSYPEAAAYDGKPGDHPTAVVQRFVSGEGRWGDAKAKFSPESVEEAQLVACAEIAAGDRTMDVRVYAVKDGALLGEKREIKRGGGGDRDRRERLAKAIEPFAKGKAPADWAPRPAPSAAPSASAAK